jgi:hypothetical protein
MPRYYHPNPRETTEAKRKLSIFWLNSRNLIKEDIFLPQNIQWSNTSSKKVTGNINIYINTIKGNAVGYPYIQLSYKSRVNGETEWTDIDYKLELLKVPCNFGGYRWYFKCGLIRNNKYCGRRVAILYSVGNYFRCRHCADLSYESCNENKKSLYECFRILAKSWKADEFYTTLKRKTYRGKPTRKYRRYLKLSEYTDEEVLRAEKSIHLLDRKLK